MKQLPRFFCDNCGCEVGHEVKACPFCGRHFASVRCPVCDYSGTEKMFLNGCPLCGYSASSSAPPPKKPTKKKESLHIDHQLPPWVYIVSFIAALVFIAFLSYTITR